MTNMGLFSFFYVQTASYYQHYLIFIILHKAQIQVDQGPQHKTIYTESIEEKVGKNLKLIGIGGNFLNRTQMA